MSPKTVILFGAGVAAVVLFLLWRNREFFDPSNPNNLAYRAASSVVVDVSGGAAAGGEDTVGGILARFREWVSGDDARIRRMLEGAPASSAGLPVFDPSEAGPYIMN